MRECTRTREGNMYKNKIGAKGLFKRIISITLCLSLIVPAFALTGCQQNYEQLKKEKVQYEKSGEYSIKFQESDLLSIQDDGEVHDSSSAKLAMNFADITKEDIIVGYDYMTENNSTDEQGNPITELKTERRTAEITQFSNDGKEISLGFKDNDDFVYNTEASYAVVIAKARAALIVEPIIPDNTLSSTIESVSSESTSNTLIIESKEGKFSPNISASDITLDYSFREMKVDSVEANGKRLTLKLSGSPVLTPDISTVYTAGEVEISANGFMRAAHSEEITFDVTVPIVSVDNQGITKSGNGRWNIDINVDGIDTSDIKPSDISFGDNVKVTDVETKSGKIVAEVETDDVDELTGTMKVKDREYLSGFSHAKPGLVPSYFDKVGDNLIIKVFFMTDIGTFDKNITKDQIKLLDGFEQGTITECELEEDDMLNLTIEVPANGAEISTMDIIGTIEFEDGALIEEWGDKAPSYYITCRYNLDYFDWLQDTASEAEENAAHGLDDATNTTSSLFGMIVNAAEQGQAGQNNAPAGGNAGNNAGGNAANNAPANNARGASQPTEAEQALKNQRAKDNAWAAGAKAVDYVNSQLTKMGGTSAEIAKYTKIAFDLGKGIATGNPADYVSAAIGIIEAMGVFEGGDDPNLKTKSLDVKVEEMNAMINEMDQKLDKVVKNQYKGMTQGFENALSAIQTDCMRAESMLKGANDIYVKNGGKVPAKNASADELKAYNAALIKLIIDEEKKGTSGFRGYSNVINRIENNYILVTTEAMKGWDKNPIFYEDSCISQYFNFDSQGYTLREAYRNNVKYQISRAYSVLSFYYEIPANADRYKDITNRMTKSYENINAHPADPKPELEKGFTNPQAVSAMPVDSVYSSTFKKTITGWRYVANGVTSHRTHVTIDTTSGDPVEKITSPYNYDKKTYDLFMSKLNGRTVKQDLLLAFPVMEDRLEMGSGVGFGGEWAKSKFRLEAQGIFNFHDWKWYEKIMTYDGKWESMLTLDTGDGVQISKGKVTFIRFQTK